MSARADRVRPLRPPCAAECLEQARQVFNTDLSDLSLAELEHERFRTARIAALHGDRLIFQGLTWLTAGEWANERLELIAREIDQRLGRTTEQVSRWSRPKGKVAAWKL